jgi:hypothetical protein
MVFGQLSYLIITVIFAGGAALIVWLLAFRHLRKYWKLLSAVVIIDLLILLILEPTALRWRAWTLNPQRTLNVFLLGAALESYIWTILVSISIASATLLWSEYEEAGLPLLKTSLIRLTGKFRTQ